MQHQHAQRKPAQPNHQALLLTYVSLMALNKLTGQRYLVLIEEDAHIMEQAKEYQHLNPDYDYGL